MKKVLLIISLILVVPTIKAQIYADSNLNKFNIGELKQLSVKSVDTEKVKIYVYIGQLYWYGIDGVGTAQSKTDVEIPHKDSSFIYLFKAYNLSKKNNFVSGIKSALLRLLSNYSALEDYNSAVKTASELIALSEETKDTINLINGLIQKGFFYGGAKDYTNQLIYSKKAIDISFKIGEYQSYILALGNTGDAYMNLNILDSANFYFSIANTFCLSKNILDPLTTVNLAEINYKLGQYEIALPIYKRGLELSSGHLRVDIIQAIANTFEKLGNKDSAFFYCKRAYRGSGKYFNFGFEYLKGILSASEKLYLLYKPINIDSAFFYQSIYISAKDSLFNQERVRLLEKNTIAEELKQNEISEKKVQEQEQRKRNIKLGLIAIFIPLFASMVYLISRKKKKNTKFVSLMGLASLLMLFEFISLLLHPYIEKFTKHDAVYMYLVSLIIASLLVPLHHKLEGWVKSKL